jgi:DNA-binding response OmpR family regulator
MTEAEEIEHLRFRVTELEKQIGLALEPPTVFGLTKTETEILGILIANKYPRRETFMVALYGSRFEAPDDKIIDVLMSRMRKKLTPFGIEITTAWGSGFYMPEPSKARARELMGTREV